MIEILLKILLTLVGIALGGYILFFGRRALWATLGIISLAAAANIGAVLVAGVDTGWELIDLQAWRLLGATAGIGALGVVLGRYKPDIAVTVIGFIAGANIALWLYDISAYLVTGVARLPEQATIWTVLTLLLINGLLGVWLVRKDRDEALILLSVLVGVELINDALGLSDTRSITAILLLSLALAGVLVQYAEYLRERTGDSPLTTPEPLASSVAYFQDLELN